MIDTHAHIYLDDFKEDIHNVLDRCRESGVEKILMPNIDLSSIDNLLDLESQEPNICISMMGLHPCYIKKDFQKDLYEIESWLNKRDFVAVGEIGTDLYWDKSLWEQQLEAFTIQLDIAKKKNLPVSIHSRNSIDETLSILEKKQDGTLRGILHCFSGTVAQAERAIQLGFALGIGGVCTFKNTTLNDVLKKIDIKNIVLETDSPYLAPVPYRGKRNEPSYLSLIIEKIAFIKNNTIEEVKQATTSNAKNIFSLL